MQAEFTREQTRLVTVGWLGAPGKARVSQYARVRVTPRPDHYAEARTSSSVVACNRVPGKAVPRTARTLVYQVVERPCPFTFLAGAQLDKAHDLLTRM